MRNGTPGFNGLRLREAREARGISGTSLADVIGVNRSAVSQYETNRQSPCPAVMEKICRAVNLPAHFFTRPSPPVEERTIFWRCMHSATKSARLRAERRYAWLRDIVGYMRQYVKMPPIAFPDLVRDDDPARLSFEEIEGIAADVRRQWGISNNGPIANVAWLLESKGAIVARGELSAETLDAFSEWDSTGRPYVILGSDKRSAARSRFDAAHELGHMILHRRIRRTAVNNGDSFKLIEDQAHRFAGALLLPAQAFSDDFYAPSLDAMRSMKQRWRVSIGLMIMRALQLGLISEPQYRQLWIKMGQRKWRKREPLDDTLPVEKPMFLEKCVQLLIGRGIIAPNELAVQIGLSSRDVETLIGLQDGYLQDAGPAVSVIGEGDEQNDEPDIVKFPFRGSA